MLASGPRSSHVVNSTDALIATPSTADQVDRLIVRREVHPQEKTLWRMLYETTGRFAEIHGVNIEEGDLDGRHCLVKAKGARTKASCRGQSREGYALKPLYRGAGTARFLPRLGKGCTRDAREMGWPR